MDAQGGVELELEKYKELYDLSREAAAQAEARFDAIETKASVYLSVLTVLVGTAGFFAKWAADQLLPPSGTLNWVLVVLAAAPVLAVAIAWLFVLRALRVHRIRVLPLSPGIIDFFDRNRLIDIYYALARDFVEVWETNTGVNERKVRQLTIAYRMIILSSIFLLSFGSCYSIHAWLLAR